MKPSEWIPGAGPVTAVVVVVMLVATLVVGFLGLAGLLNGGLASGTL